MKNAKKEVVSGRLMHLQENLKVVLKSKDYLERELPRLRDRESSLRDKISKEKKAIALVNRAKRLR